MHVQGTPVPGSQANRQEAEVIPLRAAADPDSPGGAAGATEIQLYRGPDGMRLLRLGRSPIYNLMRSGRLRSVREGRSRLIPASAIAEYVALLKREAQEVTGAGHDLGS